MGLFKRKPQADEEPLRCPNCNERVPEGVDRCAMCGHDLSDLVAQPRDASEQGTPS